MLALPDSTEHLLREVDQLAAAEKLVLAGGTALALRIGHRSSADLDFVFTQRRLPRRLIEQLLAGLRRKHEVVPVADVAAEEEFLEAGLELGDYQQDYSADGVKLTFFVPDPRELMTKLQAERRVAQLKRVRVLDLDALFLMKAVTLNRRITVRDLFDLFTLVEEHGFAVADIFRAADRHGFSADVLKSRLLHASRRLDDPGVETPKGSAPSFEQLKEYFAAAINRLEQSEAEAVLKKRPRK